MLTFYDLNQFETLSGESETAEQIQVSQPVLMADESLTAETPEMSNCALVGLCNASPTLSPTVTPTTVAADDDGLTLDLPPEENFFDRMKAFLEANSWLLWLILGVIIYLNRDKIF